MSDVNARIVVVAEASAAKQNIAGVKRSLSEVTDARLKDLRIAQSKSKLELAEYNSMIAAQKAYNAEIALEGAKKRLAFRSSNGARAKEIEQLTAVVEKLHGEFLPLANAEATANLQAYEAKVSHDALIESFNNVDLTANKATKSLKKYGAMTYLSRAASRALHMDLGEGVNPAMLKAGIIAAGAASAVKLVKMAFEAADKPLLEQIELNKQYGNSLQQAWKIRSDVLSKQNEAIDTLTDLNSKTELSAQEQVKYSKAIDTLRGSFDQLGISIDKSSGRVADFDGAMAKLKQKQINEEINALKAQLKQNSYEKELWEQRRETAGASGWWLLGLPQLLTWDRETRIGGEAAVKESVKEIEKIGERNREIMQRISELRALTPEKDAELLDQKRGETQEKSIEKRISLLQQEIKMQELLRAGKEREVEIIKIRQKLDQEREKLRGKELAVFDQNRKKLEEAMLAEYDSRKTAKPVKRDNTPLDIAREFFRFRATSQSAIMANSIEGMRLQSRQLLNTSVNDPMKQTEKNTKTMADKITEVKRTLDNIARAVTTNGGSAINFTGIKVY